MLTACLISDTFEDHQQFLTERVENNPDIVAADLQQDGFNLHYRSVGTARRAVALWIHGTPGGWSDIGRLMVNQPFTDQVLLVSVDRPGWGRSQYLDQSRVVPTFAEQNRLLAPLLHRVKSQHPSVPLILVGHSWGASLVPTIASEHTQQIAAVLALSGPFDPELAAPRWYNYAARIPPIRWIIGEGLRRSNVEMFALPEQLQSSAPLWRSSLVPTLVLQGEDDGLVPVEHAEFARRTFNPQATTVVRVADQGHLFQFERTPLIGRCVLALAQQYREVAPRTDLRPQGACSDQQQAGSREMGSE